MLEPPSEVCRCSMTDTEPCSRAQRHSFGLCVPSLTEPPAMRKGSPGAQLLFSFQAFVVYLGPRRLPRGPAAGDLPPSRGPLRTPWPPFSTRVRHQVPHGPRQQPSFCILVLPRIPSRMRARGRNRGGGSGRENRGPCTHTQLSLGLSGQPFLKRSGLWGPP